MISASHCDWLLGALLCCAARRAGSASRIAGRRRSSRCRRSARPTTGRPPPEERSSIGWEASQADRPGPAHHVGGHAAAAGAEGLLFLSRGHRAELPQVARQQAPRSLVTGFVQARADGRVTFGCYVYDVDKGRELAPQGLRRRAGRLAARGAQMLGPRLHRGDRSAGHLRHAASPMSPRAASAPAAVERIAIMDSDGSNHRYLTAGDAMVLTPRLSPKRVRASPTSASPAARPQVRLLDVASGSRPPAGAERRDQLRAALFSRTAARIAFSMMLGANSDIYVAGAERRRAAAADDLARRSTPIPASRPTARRSCSKATVADRSSST